MLHELEASVEKQLGILANDSAEAAVQVAGMDSRAQQIGSFVQLSGKNIPFDAKVIGICDAFDAMTSTRPYRKGMPIAQALQIIEQNYAEQFDETLGRLFVENGRAGAWDHIVGYSDEGIPMALCPSCGPILVRHTHTKEGDHVGCPACQADFVWKKQHNDFIPFVTGQKATPAQLDIAPDSSIIQKLVTSWAKANQTSTP